MIGGDIADAGTIWVCQACGKRAIDRVAGGISQGWDESCFMHAALCRDDDTLKLGQDGRVIAAVAAGAP